MKFNERILLYELSLNDTDDEVINYVQLNKSQVVSQSIQKTAQDLYTVPNTIVRLAKKLGYASFSEMKYELKKELNAQGVSTVVMNRKLPTSIIKTHQLIDDIQIKKVVDLLYQAKEVIFIGVGDTSHFCEMFSNNLTCIDIPHQHFYHRHEMMYKLNQITSKHVCIAISVRGQNEDVVTAAKIAKEKGATVITLTHFYQNTLASIGDIKMYFYGEHDELNGYNITDKSGLILLIRIVSEAIWSEYENRNNMS